MKILILSSYTPSLFWFRMDMMQSFLQMGHSVVAIANEKEEKWCKKFACYGIKYRQVDVQRNGTNPVRDIKTFFALRRILEIEHPDRIFVYQSKTIIYGALAAKQLGISEIYPLIAGAGSIFLGKGVKEHFLRNIIIVEYKLALRRCPKIFFQNKDDVDLFKRYNLIEDKQVVLINGSGVNLNKFSVSLLPNEPTFLFVGRLIRDKGLLEYLEAAKLIKNEFSKVRFLLVGPFDTNPSALKLEDLTEYIREGIVEYFGEQEDVRPYLARCSVFVLPSYREGTPKAVLEAMSCGRAIITTNAPGCRETVVDGENGFLVPIKNVKILADKMRELIIATDLVKKMGKASRFFAEERFDVNKVNYEISKTMNII